MTAYCLALSYRPLPLWVADLKHNDYYDLTSQCCNSKEETEAATMQSHPVSCSMDSLLFDELLMGADKSDGALCNLLFDNHVFLGMVSFQYQAKPDIVHLVEQLDKSCIRFVHFSKENELRSRVFAEKMGLEAGWNCHISLEKEQSPDGVISSNCTFQDRLPIASRINMSPLPIAPWLSSSLPNVRTMLKSYSLASPSFGISSIVRRSVSQEHSETIAVSSSDSELLRILLPDNQVHRSSFSGRSSVSAEFSVAPSFANAEKFLLANRARLPKGIENVRPHLDNVDNVPLLVSLFTDCTARTTCEMIEIMQEYGEVVCVVGSSLNPENTAIFCRANVAISVEPMIPSGCCDMQMIKEQSEKSALEIAHFINSLPCSLSVKLDEAFLLNNTIDLSRHMLLTFRISFYFFLSVSTLITVVHLLALLFAMPRPLTANMVLWLLSGVLPPLCATLALSPLRSGGTELVTFKNKSRLGRKEVQIACGTFATKFAPTAFALFLLYRALVHYLCKFEAQMDADSPWPLVNGTCQLYLLWNSNSDQLYVVQRLCFSFFVLYTVALSASHVFYYEHIWKRVPFRSTPWTAVSGVVLLLQLSFCILPICWSSRLLRLMTGIPWYVYIAGCLWPFLAICVSELAKRFEISRFNRDQRRRPQAMSAVIGILKPAYSRCLLPISFYSTTAVTDASSGFDESSRRRDMLERILRVDHAGEVGADNIYSGQLLVLGGSSTGRLIQRMKTQEAHHLNKFEDLIGKHAIQPTALLPLWNVAGFALGVITASLGRQAAMACTVAVEEVIGQHYNDQIRELINDNEEAHKELIQTLKEFRDDELEHLDCGIQNDAEKAPFYALLTWLIQTGCKSAIWISERV
ncbi:ubiquinone biosynthesis protein COQ7 [Trichuris suis]|nr:ubiquinone biosynthesis protein COQ7 [Trichuris suis]